MEKERVTQSVHLPRTGWVGGSAFGERWTDMECLACHS